MIKAKYVSVFDDSIQCESNCDYDPDTKTVTNIKKASNAKDADRADALTDEYVILPDGKKLNEEDDGVTFIY